MGYLAKPDDYKLVDLVRQNRHLYDKNHSDYRDRSKNEMTWNTFATVLGASEDALRKRFRNLRDRFTKEKRIRKDMRNDHTLPLIFKKMLFLLDHLQHRQQRDDGSSLNETNESAEMMFEEIDKQAQILDGSDPEETAQDPNESNQSSLQNQIVYIVDESGNLIPHKATDFISKNNSESEKLAIKQPNVILVRYEPEEKLAELESKDIKDEAIQSLEYSGAEVDVNGFVNFKGDLKTDSSKELEGGTSESVNDNQHISPGEEAYHNDKIESSNIISLGEKGNEVTQYIGKTEQNSDESSSHKMQDEVTDTKEAANIPQIVSTCTQQIGPVYSYSVPKVSNVRTRQKQIIRARKRKLMKKNSTSEKQINTPESTQIMCNETVESPVSCCNKDFCSMVKHYLDKITAPDRLSAARLQILTLLHKELYSTYP